MGGEAREDLNLSELLLQISSDVASIKTDMQNFKDSYKNERDNLLSRVDDVRSDCEKEIARQSAKIEQLESDIRALKSADDRKDAKRYRTVVAFILTGLGGMLLCRVPDFLLFLAKLNITSGGQ